MTTGMHMYGYVPSVNWGRATLQGQVMALQHNDWGPL